MRKLSKYEKETIINWNEGETIASIYTFNASLKRRLEDFSRKYPLLCRLERSTPEGKEIELILCDLELPDGTAMELFHTLRRVAGMFQMKNPPVRLLPFFILTENNDLATEYEYRHEGVNDYITAPVNIPELIRQVLFFVE